MFNYITNYDWLLRYYTRRHDGEMINLKKAEQIARLLSTEQHETFNDDLINWVYVIMTEFYLAK